MAFKRPKRVSFKELMKPIKAACAKCKGTCYIILQRKGNGMCLCSTCTFNSTKNLTLSEMLSTLYSKRKKRLKRKVLKQ